MNDHVKIGLRLNISESWGAPELKETLNYLLESLSLNQKAVRNTLIEKYGKEKAKEIFQSFNILETGLKPMKPGRPSMR